VVFDRGAIGPQPSAVIRRGFSDRRSARVVLKHVTQPQLVPSSAGALYYAIGRGWQRWDFGEARPRRTPFRGARAAPLVAYERGRWLLVKRHGCESELAVRLADGRRRVLASPSGAGGLPTRQYSACHVLGALGWRGRQPLSAWAVIPAASVEAHSERGLTGAVLATPVP
jgi:membrane protein DedA with SNARE-associated domain